MSRKVLRAPIELGGLALPNMQTIQDQKGMVNVMRQLQLGKEIATDFTILLAQPQLDSGLVHPILDKTYIDISYIEPGMIVHLHDRLDALDGSIVIENQWCPKLQRIHDESIMEKISKLPGVKPREVQHTNQCRKYMRVITTSQLDSMDDGGRNPDCDGRANHLQRALCGTPFEDSLREHSAPEI
eukprot:scaffold3976_cov45-Cyclotella_meneghiniana.AAC.9